MLADAEGDDGLLFLLELDDDDDQKDKLLLLDEGVLHVCTALDHGSMMRDAAARA